MTGFKKYAQQLLASLRHLWATEPVRVTYAVAAAVMFACAKLGVVVSKQDVIGALALLLPLVLGGEIARSRVSPS